MDTQTQTLLPSNYEKYSEDIQKSIIEYITQLSDIERKACFIAKNHLGSSFNIVKSNGYNDWLKSKPKL
jgi:hypothetical protein